METALDTTSIIEVMCDQTGKAVEAEDAESALVAARVLLSEEWNGNQGHQPTATFRVNGRIIRACVSEKALLSATS